MSPFGGRSKSRTRSGVRLTPKAPSVFCLLVVVLALGPAGVAESAKEESSDKASIGLCIRRQTRVRDRICLEPPYETADADRLLADPLSIEVSSNDPDWGLVVRIGASDADATHRQAPHESGEILCRLRDSYGTILNESPLEDGSAFLQGNGLCGSHRMYLEVLDASTHSTAARPEGLAIEVRGSEGGAR